VLRGIRQRGNLLGSAKAPYQLIEYTDLQCPFCARFSVEILPTIVQKYVRTGEVQLVMRGLAFIGQDSVTALRTATAAGSQNRMWNVTELLFANQGAENAWLSDKLLRVLVRAAGAKVDKVFAARNGTAVRATIARWARQAQDAGVGGTPSFYVGQRGGPFAPLSLSALTVADFRSALDGALGR
jgi:protein-disulfide isomerase